MSPHPLPVRTSDSYVNKGQYSFHFRPNQLSAIYILQQRTIDKAVYNLKESPGVQKTEPTLQLLEETLSDLPECFPV